MSLRDPSYQSAIELGLYDTEYVERLKNERGDLRRELQTLLRITPRHRTLGTVSRIDQIRQRLVRIKEMLRK